ncbi:MAG: hypothetical protein JSS65_13395 [Armatimonadetes bacterium]|nr:hypothetical protein [Armatimonadota bacterium]
MAKVVAGLMAMVALGASVLSGAEPWTCLARGAIAYVVGNVAGAFWEALAKRVPTVVQQAAHDEAEELLDEQLAA